ncbi:MAG: hypothetical protein M0P58_08325 [Bacteroidales bacterium]|nr:hypothetical protein [Bacteroidales bacterium]
MKLILKEYLASLKERDELDSVIPDLLSELGLNVFSRPGRGTRQNGVDVAAFGALNGGEKKLYLISIKAGDISRSNWDSEDPQSLRPSLNEIIDSYIPNRVPTKYKDKPIVICLCFGGDIQEQVRNQITGFTNQNTKGAVKFEEWNGDKLAEMIFSGFIQEKFVPKDFQSMLRKALALLDEPDISYKRYSELVHAIVASEIKNDKAKIKVIRLLNICLWILYSWCRKANNIESAYLSSELTLLNAWELVKTSFKKEDRKSATFRNAFLNILRLYIEISNQYLIKILPETESLHSLSSAIRASNPVDVNLRLFDVLGRIALSGVWTYWLEQVNGFAINKKSDDLKPKIELISLGIVRMIENNSMLYTPYLDSQAIEIGITSWFLAMNSKNLTDLHEWYARLIQRVHFNFQINDHYPSNINSYHEQIEFPMEKSDSYREEVTAGSILYPLLAAYSAILNYSDQYKSVQSLQTEFLKHCNFQIWFPDETSETHFYLNDERHGATLSHVITDRSETDFLTQLFNECDATSYFQNLSAVKYVFWPIIFVCCRHYRLPLPIHFLKSFLSYAPSNVQFSEAH